ncbi:MAG: DUF4129 domain-containing protein [Chloroflexota bacterium]|nr:DUF4129 domain-containing protein [Chloroflexota bacterium]
MTVMRERLVTGSLLLSESAWLVALLGILSFPFGATGSPISWVAVLAVMALSLIWARTLSMVIMPPLMAYGLQMIAGVIVVYLMVASQVPQETGALNFGWIGAMRAEDVSDRFILGAVYGSLGGAALWWRGGHIGALDIPAESLGTSFRIGILVLAIAAVIDIAHPANLNVFPMMFLFFASGVAGLIVANMAPATQQTNVTRAWTRVIGGLVGALVVLGLIFSLLQRDVLAFIAAPLLWVLQILATIVFYIVIFPLAYFIDYFTRGIFALLIWLGGDPRPDTELAMPQGPATFEGFANQGEAEPAALLLLQILQWSIVAAIIIAVLVVMALAYRRRVRRRQADADGERESVIEGADITYDFANLLFNMLPSRFRRRRQNTALRVPSDDPNITDVFRIYFGMLMLSEKRGNARHASETPSEFQPTLERTLPRNLVRAATRAFIRACYGHYPATREEIDEMRTELEDAAKSDKK